MNLKFVLPRPVYNPLLDFFRNTVPLMVLLEKKITFCVFFILSVYIENTRKVLKCLWRMRGKYLSIFCLVWTLVLWTYITSFCKEPWTCILSHIWCVKFLTLWWHNVCFHHDAECAACLHTHKCKINNKIEWHAFLLLYDWVHPQKHPVTPPPLLASIGEHIPHGPNIFKDTRP